jgi:hypothetical protein
LPDEERTPHSPRIRLPGLRIHKHLLRLDHTPRLPLIIDAQNLTPDLEIPAMAADGQRLQKLNLALAVDDAAVVEFRDARDGLRARAAVEVDDFLVGVLEGEDDRVGGEGGEGGVQFVEKVEFVGRAAYAVGEEEDVAFEPGDSDLFRLTLGVSIADSLGGFSEDRCSNVRVWIRDLRLDRPFLL